VSKDGRYARPFTVVEARSFGWTFTVIEVRLFGRAFTQSGLGRPVARG